jgi:hypothetical protein
MGGGEGRGASKSKAERLSARGDFRPNLPSLSVKRRPNVILMFLKWADSGRTQLGMSCDVSKAGLEAASRRKEGIQQSFGSVVDGFIVFRSSLAAQGCNLFFSTSRVTFLRHDRYRSERLK